MANIPPVVRSYVLCDDVAPNTRDPSKIDAYGIFHEVRHDPVGGYPAVLPVMCAYLRLSGGRGAGVGRVVAIEADTGTPVFASLPHPITYPADPLALIPVVFRILDCRFPRAGLYWIEFWHDGQELISEPLTVR